MSKVKRIIKSTEFQRYFKNTSWLIGERMISMGVAFVIGALVQRHLGAENMGILAYGLSIAGFLDIFIIMGLENTLTRNLVREPDKAHEILGSATGIRLIGSAIALALALGVIFFTPSDRETDIILLILLGSSLVRGGQIFYNVLEAKVLTKYDAKIKLLTLVVVSLFRLGLIFLFSASVIWFAFAYVLMEVINLSGQLWVYSSRKLGDVRKWSYSKAYAKKLFQASWPLIFSSLLAGLYMKIDQIMIKHMLDDAQTGIYYTAVRFSTIFIFLPMLINNSLAPAVYEAKKKDREQYLNRLRQIMSINALITYGIILVISFTGQFLIDFIYGEEFTDAGEVIIVHIWSLLFVAIGAVSTTFLLAENLEKLRLYRTLVGALINVGLNFWMIPEFGIMGAAYATLISQVAASYLTYLASPRTFEIFRIQTEAILLIGPIKLAFQYLTKNNSDEA